MAIVVKALNLVGGLVSKQPKVKGFHLTFVACGAHEQQRTDVSHRQTSGGHRALAQWTVGATQPRARVTNDTVKLKTKRMVALVGPLGQFM